MNHILLRIYLFVKVLFRISVKGQKSLMTQMIHPLKNLYDLSEICVIASFLNPILL